MSKNPYYMVRLSAEHWVHILDLLEANRAKLTPSNGTSLLAAADIKRGLKEQVFEREMRTDG